jgi:hypothetical protein
MPSSRVARDLHLRVSHSDVDTVCNRRRRAGRRVHLLRLIAAVALIVSAISLLRQRMRNWGTIFIVVAIVALVNWL